MSSGKPKNQLKHAVMQISSGGSAGFVEVCLMQPLDVVKTRFQVQTMVVAADAHSYTGVFDCFRKMVRAEGFLSLWKGLLPPILIDTPKRAVKFVTFEQYKRAFLFGAPAPTPLTYSLAGFAAGCTEGILVNPFEVVKIALQTNHAHHKQVPSTWKVTRDIIRNEGIGLRGINKAVHVSMLRNGVFNLVYFGLYHTGREVLPQFEDSRLEILRRLGLGFVAGVLGCCFNIQFDVVKSRIQGPQPVPGQIKYLSMTGTFATVYREEGIRAFYNGLLPKVLRLGPGGAILMVVYEKAYAFLQTKFPD